MKSGAWLRPTGEGEQDECAEVQNGRGIVRAWALALSATVATGAWAQTPAVDPAAVQILKRMADYLGSLQQFSLQTQNTIEDMIDSGHRVDVDIWARVIVGRPNKLRAERRGDIDQIFFYDGK